LRTGWIALTALLAGATAHAQLAGPVGGRFVDVVELEDHDDQADIVVQFNCSLRYVTHQPATEGKELRIQLLPQGDCGVTPGTQLQGELPPLSSGGHIIDAVRVDADVPGQLTLAFSFRRAERFVIAQGADPRGLRLRLIDRNRGRGKVMVREPAGAVSNYAINLESQPADFPPEALQLARDRLKAPIFVSQAVVDEQTWYRLRAGPIDKRADADRLLNLALADYPRAWLAIGDDKGSASGGAEPEVLPAVERLGSDPALEPAALAKLVADARAAMNARDYPQAIAVLTKLQRQPEFPLRAAMQELLGLARERSGQIAHAKAEYEEYLRRYPAGEAAERIGRRLATLRAASMQARTGTGGGGEANKGWTTSGGFAQTYRRDNTSLTNTATGPITGTVSNGNQTQSNNSLYTDVDFLARHRSERYDLIGRTSVGYARNFSGASATAASDSIKRISIVTLEVVDRKWGLLARVGRQTQNLDGVLGSFDGLFASWQWRPAWALNFTTGYPVERTDQGINTQRKFWAVAVPYTPVGKHWDASVYYTQWLFDGITDRRAAGFQGRLLLPHASVTGIVDYDVFYKLLNTAAVLGTMQLPAHWNLSFDAERRNAPVLTTRNALIGEPFTTLSQLLAFEQQINQGLSPQALLETIYSAARNNTPVSESFNLTIARPLGSRFQFATTIGAQRLGEVPGIGSIPGQPATGLEWSYQSQIYGSNLWKDGDFHVLSVGYTRLASGKTASLGVTSREPIGGAWRLGPRLTLEQQQITSDGSKELSLLPSALLDYQRGHRLLQVEAGGQIGKRDSNVQTQNSRRYYVSIAYRVGF
jgi:tetratricopeptide (TPR) repeat protein